MTRPPRPSRRSRLRRLATGLAIVATATAAAVAPSTGRGAAAPSTSSTAIADQAGLALAALSRWETTQHPVDFVRFVQRRDATATMTADEIGIDASALGAAWAAAPTTKQQVVLAAMSQLGVPYRSMRSDPEVGFDCSGLTIWAYAQAGVTIPRTSSDQIRAAESVDLEHADAGDLVYYPGHVGLYLGAGGYLHSPNPGNEVEATYLPNRSLRYGDAID